MTTTLQRVYDEGRLIRGEWSREEDGRQMLCLYTALLDDPDARPETCPASVCPPWLAHLLPWLDDAPSLEEWPGIIERVIAIAPRLAELSPEVEWRVLALCVREAMRHTDTVEAIAVCERVAQLCEIRGRGEVVAGEERAAAAEAAAAAGRGAWAAAVALEALEASDAAAAVLDAAAALEADPTPDRLADAILTAIEGDLAREEATQ